MRRVANCLRRYFALCDEDGYEKIELLPNPNLNFSQISPNFSGCSMLLRCYNTYLECWPLQWSLCQHPVLDAKRGGFEFCHWSTLLQSFNCQPEVGLV